MRGLITGVSFERQLMAGAVVIAAAAVSAPASAQTRNFDVPEQTASRGIPAFAKQAGVQILASGNLVAGKRTKQVRGRYPVEEGLKLLLDGTGLVASFNGSGQIITIQPAPRVTASAVEGEPFVADEEIIVTGSRIRGSVSPSPVTRITAEQMRDAGQTNLGDVVRALPQNYAGGQNPGVVRGSPRFNDENLSSASSVNLRGIGADATLTILNGRRLSYNAAQQAVDISAIPISAVQRIEVLTDGASAIYGSDAVAGVVNVILKRDYDGVQTSARFGASTDGGNEQQQYELLAGKRWSSGGLIAAVQYDRIGEVTAGQRSYTSSLDPSQTLIPFQRHYSALVSGHQSLGGAVEFGIDALYSNRRDFRCSPQAVTGSCLVYGSEGRSKNVSFAISPQLTVGLPGDWQLTAMGSYGTDKSTVQTDFYFGSSLFAVYPAEFSNRVIGGEIGAEGPVFALPGGAARLAVGAGVRRNNLRGYTASVAGGVTAVQTDYNDGQTTQYLFGEVSLPIVSPQNDIAFLDRFVLTGALRYERYPGVDELATPKLGFIAAPSPDVEFRATWGKSFKAPTLYQRFRPQTARLLRTLDFGAAGYPAGATVLEMAGANPDLKAERATTWTATLGLMPSFAPGLKIDISYFRTRYRDRVVIPIESRTGALTNPLYTDFINFAPTRAQIDANITGSSGLLNNSGVPVDLSTVVAIVDKRDRNASSQLIRGLDVSTNYDIALSDRNRLSAGVSLTYLKSRQELIAGQGNIDMAGTIFDPPHWRARANLVWSNSAVTAGAFLSHAGGLRDDRRLPVEHVGSTTTLDLTLRAALDDSGLKGTAVSFSLLNAFNAKPDLIRTTDPSTPPYDSTNYSAAGRFIGFTLEQRW
ncbi:TonB-dependent receptor [Sphingopyxis sp.]|uniref:TonB-dependent receptor n=1 Tax=Sphingopyxis sp. TaxID=1908224 RepID=UPI002B48447B|nr:TonB-dependent receptor [Sphingopyxis sp.]HJS11633.1 TonB-dependent receptor [Sphingopyxis sp.]